jgi:ABC-type polysaccharide/polyol phosphate export permease
MGRVVRAFLHKQVLEYIRSPPALFWTIAWPIFWLFMTIYVFLSGVPEEFLPQVRASVTIHMIAFGLATQGLVDLPGSIAEDVERGLYLKLSSMPIGTAGEILGRILGSIVFGAITIAVIGGVGFAVGSEFEAGLIDAIYSIPYFLTLLLSSMGLGLVIANIFRKSRVVVGVGVTLLLLASSISGIFTPYPFLPDEMRLFSRIYPITASMHVIKRYLLPSEFERLEYDFDPSSYAYIGYTVASSIVTLAVGLALHAAFASRRARRY